MSVYWIKSVHIQGTTGVTLPEEVLESGHGVTKLLEIFILNQEASYYTMNDEEVHHLLWEVDHVFDTLVRGVVCIKRDLKSLQLPLLWLTIM